jgi:spore maturation protein CgeB
MRILVVGAIEGGTVPMGRSLHAAFTALGQESRLLDYSDQLAEFVSIRASRDPARIRPFMDGVRKRLLDEVLRFQPQIVLGMAQSPLNNKELLSALRRAGIRLGYWFVEDGQVFPYWRTIAAQFDRFFTIQKEPFFSELKAIGCRGAHYLPAAFDDLAPLSSAPAREDIPVSFVGAPYPNRVHFLESLKGVPLQIFGEGWEKFNNSSVSIGNRRLGAEECRAVYCRSTININLHSSTRSEGFAEGDFVNPRTFELAGLGRFQLTDQRLLLPELFSASEISASATWEKLRSAVDYFLGHETERKAYVENARLRVLKDHTYRNRAQEILSALS